MGWKTQQSLAAAAWELVEGQHGVVSRKQLLGLGMSSASIEHRLSNGDLHRVARGVYARGRPEPTRRGIWMATMSAGIGAALSHRSAAALWGVGEEERGVIELTQRAAARERAGIRIYRRPDTRAGELTERHGIPVTTVVRTLVDVSRRFEDSEIERAVSEADARELINPEALRRSLSEYTGVPGVARLRSILDRNTFRLTDSELERRFLKLALGSGLGLPLTRQRLNGFRVDFYWPDLGIVVETDGLRYHRTPAQQQRDHVRDQAHTAAGLRPLRFTHAQVCFDPVHVRATLRATAAQARLGHRPPLASDRLDVGFAR
jgi:very-short-patch-repair endonuclease